MEEIHGIMSAGIFYDIVHIKFMVNWQEIQLGNVGGEI